MAEEVPFRQQEQDTQHYGAKWFLAWRLFIRGVVFIRRLPWTDDIAFDRLVDLAKLRWRIERDYQELKQELGFGDYEGRGWRGFHHHATLCIAAYGFLIAERGALSPQDRLAPRSSRDLQFPTIPTPRRRRSAPNGMCRTRSQPCADILSSPSPGPARDALVAMRQSENPQNS
jgi:hypothetical protein